MTNFNIKAIDDGYGDLKFNSLGQPELIPSFVSSFRETSGIALENKLKYVAVEINGERYVVGDYAVKLDPDIHWTGGANKHTDSHFPILFKAALGLMTRNNREVIDILMMNLPINYDTEDRRQLLTNIAKGTHDVAVSLDGRTFVRKVVNVQDVVIKKQPFGSLCDLMFNGNGDIESMDIARGFNVIVDIGARTVNILSVNALDTVDELTTQTSDGMYKSYLKVGRYLEGKFGTTIPDGKLSLIMNEKRIKDVDLSSVIEKTYQEHAGSIVRTLDKLLINSGMFVDNIIFTGGGAEILKPHFYNSLPHINKIFLDRFANVRGLRKYGLKIAKKRTKEQPVLSVKIGGNEY